MNKVFEEIGKGLIAFGNIMTALVLFKDYFDKSHDNSLYLGIILLISFYFIGGSFLKKSKELEDE
jgi:hypothetical protein